MFSPVTVCHQDQIKATDQVSTKLELDEECVSAQNRHLHYIYI